MATHSRLAIIRRVRALIGDLDAAQFSDNEIEDVLLRHSVYDRYLPWSAAGSVSTGGSVAYLEFFGPKDYDEGVVFFDGTYSAITPSYVDYDGGYARFGTAPTRPVMAHGRRYDIYGAAAELLDSWAASKALLVDSRDPNVQLQLSQQFAQLRQLAEQYRKRAKVRAMQVWRRDSGE